MNYINKESFRCLIGKQSKNVIIHDNLFLWEVNSKKHFAVYGKLTSDNLKILSDRGSSNFHYITQSNIDSLSTVFKVDKSKGKSILLDITDLSFKGKKNDNIRYCLNKCKDKFIIESNFRKLKDVEDLIESWSNDYTEKYFRDNSGKNYYFYKNNFHEGLLSIFVYKDDKLMSFGTLSNHIDGHASYVLGKALYKEQYGLSEFTDVELYKLGSSNGIKYVNMGGGSNKSLLNYKKKFNYTELIHFDGNIK